MKWLVPLGFLGLIGIVVLILIYILKPNFHQKLLSSTYVWKLSLKYRKKRIPISRLRNILLLICQILIITLIATALARPAIAGEEYLTNEKIVVIDSSASMWTQVDGVTRYQRAVTEVKQLAQSVYESEDGKVTVILAGETPDYLGDPRMGFEDKDTLYSLLDGLVANGNLACGYGEDNLEGAMALVEDALYDNPTAEVLVYTGADSTNNVNSGLKFVDVSDENEWNVAILDCAVNNVENFWEFTVDVASYQRDQDVSVYVQVSNVNGESRNVNMRAIVRCRDNQVSTVVFDSDNYEPIYSYETARVYVEYDDSLAIDNNYYVYGGTKEVINIQYSSKKSNPFFNAALLTLRDRLSSRWKVAFKDVVGDQVPAIEGFDLYIFEHYTPSVLPTDGVVLLMHPDGLPPTLGGVQLGAKTTGDAFTGVAGHILLNEVNASQITALEIYPIVTHEGFDPVLYCGNYPVMIVRNKPMEKVAILSFDIHMSTVSMTEFMPLFYNLFNYYFPSTATQTAYKVNDTITLNARSDRLSVMAPDGTEQQFDTFPAQMQLTMPGTYSITQKLISQKYAVENVFVKVDSDQSNVAREVGDIVAPSVKVDADHVDVELLIYAAIALVALLFVEWALHAREFNGGKQ